MQSLVIVLAAGVLPLSGASFQVSLETATTINSIAASLLAALAALVIFRRVTAYPGVRALGFILPAFSITYGLAIATLLLARMPYSNAILSIGFVASIALTFLISVYLDRREIRRFYLVPGGNSGLRYEVPRCEWIVLTQPALPESRHGVIVADLRHDHPPEWERMLAAAAVARRPVYHTKQLRESLTGRVSIEHLSENSLGSLLPNLAYAKIKRLSDIVLALILFPPVLIVGLLVGIAIRMDSPGPAIFRQKRMGYGGHPFTMYKFRSMRERDVAEGEDAARADSMTQGGDARITRLGQFLRRSRLDELPQLWNVLKGEMSIIGPRPEAMPLSGWYETEIPFYVYRHIVRPGITGWAQINQGHVADLHEVHEKLQYDFYYIKNYSAWLDIVIGIRTFGIIFTGFGWR